ncbi:hypothetical protein ACIHFE_33800 [Streptomyces sp. NPDC052396]|uniref:hypothetical protein n=1 Tax=Streptomyces sp. NPDC052396 TaxID=3365689 RepID=UPI0037D5A3B8
MTDMTGVDAAEAAARSLLDTRLAPIRDLAAAREARNNLRDQLAAAEKEYARAYNASTAVGWTTAELTKLDYDEPGKPPKRTYNRSTSTGSQRGKGKRKDTSEATVASVPEQREMSAEETVESTAPTTADASLQ